MSRRKRNKPMKSPEGAAPAPAITAPATVANRGRAAVIAGVLIVACGVVGYIAAEFLAQPTSAKKSKIPAVVEGDGVRGPRRMV